MTGVFSICLAILVAFRTSDAKGLLDNVNGSISDTLENVTLPLNVSSLAQWVENKTEDAFNNIDDANNTSNDVNNGTDDVGLSSTPTTENVNTEPSQLEKMEALLNDVTPDVTAYFDPVKSRLHPSDTVTVTLNISFPLDWSLTLNYTAEARSKNTHIVGVISDPEISETDTNELIVTFDLKAGNHYGKTTIFVSVKIWTTTEKIVIINLEYAAEVERPASKSNTQNALTYINLGLCLFCLFLAACDVNGNDVREAGSWIGACLLFQTVLIPVFCLALVEIFDVSLLQTVGIMAVSISPTGLIVVPFAAALQADICMVVGLVVLSYLLAAVSMPIWSLQLDRLAELPLRPQAVPYSSLFVLSLVSLCVILLGALLNHYQPTTARKLNGALVPFAYFVIVILFITTLIGGNDFFGMILWKVGLACFLWTLTVAVIVVVLFATTSSSKIPKMKAAGIFLLLKSQLYGIQFLNSTMRAPQADAASIGAFFFTVMTLLCAVASTFVFVCYGCLAKREMRGRDKLVYEVQAETNVDYTGYDNSFENNPIKMFYSGKDTDKLTQAQMNASAWGTPAIGWIGN